MRNILTTIVLQSLLFLFISDNVRADDSKKLFRIEDEEKKISCLVDYSQGCFIQELQVNGRNVLSPGGVQTFVQVGDNSFSSAKTLKPVELKYKKNVYLIQNIQYGTDELTINEIWSFTPMKDHIIWRIERQYSSDAILEDMGFPMWSFKALNTWKGGILDNGGMVWCKYLNGENATYGVHTPGVTYWEPELGDALRISMENADTTSYLGAAYSNKAGMIFTCRQYVADAPLKQRYNLSRSLGNLKDVFQPLFVKKGTETVTLKLEYQDYNAVYSRGDLKGMNENAVRELLNTTARYGVVDNGIVGGNGWTTNWKCMHEPFFGQVAWTINDPNYTANLAYSLDQERDYALLPEGRMLSRWHDVQGDEIEGTYDQETGYYEARWGYTIDSQTGYVLNTTDLFAQTGDLEWIRSHKSACERVLDWLIHRDSNGNDIFEMKNNSISEQTASDWTDIVWASFENAFVNAQMYGALVGWADIEVLLGDQERSIYYLSVAEKLKRAFNKSIYEGGFWYPEKKQYIYWRDNDGSIHGDNLFTPVNFAAIAYGVCDDKVRIAEILDHVENRMIQEKLFHWPLCFDSFKREEVEGGNWPFPNYENGDIFPTWGFLGIRSYAEYKPEIAVKYIRLLLHQYTLDGLSSQRYSRVAQKGVGNDILSGICTSITALYRDVYGIRPHWNYLELNPHLINDLSGTNFDYWLRGDCYHLSLSPDSYSVKFGNFEVSSSKKIGVSSMDGALSLYLDSAKFPLQIKRRGREEVKIRVQCDTEEMHAIQILEKGKYYLILNADTKNDYLVTLDGNPIEGVWKDGYCSYNLSCKANVVISVKNRLK